MCIRDSIKTASERYGVSPAHTAYISPENNTRHVKPTEIAIKVLSAICRGVYGGIGGAIGMTIGDLFNPVYVVYAPKTFILKFCIGLITGPVSYTHLCTKDGFSGKIL